MTLAKGTPIVVFGDDWGRNVSTMQHLFARIIPDYPVVWINGIGHRKPRLTSSDLRRATRKVGAMLGSKRKTDALVGGAGYPDPAVILQPRVLPWHDNPVIYAYNVRAMRVAIKHALADLGHANRRPMLVTGTPPSAGLVGQLGELAAIYLCQDDYLNLPSSVTTEMIRPLEKALLAKVDATVCTAESLTRTKIPHTGRVYYLPQGVNYDHFAARRPTPPDLAALPAPVIGFAGAIYDRCDVALLRALADAFPQGSIVLIGPVQMDTAVLSAPNIHILGPRPYADLPAYMQTFDVGIIPYVINAETVAVDPLKLLEYCAAGVPCVTTALPEARKYSEVVRVTATRDEFVAAVGEAARLDREVARERGQALASLHTWQRRASRLMEIVSDEVDRRANVTREVL